MAKYTCPQCSKKFVYCSGCALTPDPYKERGFCSKECYKASKIEVFKVEAEPIKEEVFIEEESEEIIEVEVPTEDISMVESEIKQETYNTYKKKKNKYK